MKNRFYESIPVVMWVGVLAASLWWNTRLVDDHTLSVVTNVGRAFFEEIQTTRLWNARHGGGFMFL